MPKHVVSYFESERGWDSSSWKREFDTKEQALKAVEDNNKHYDFNKPAPDYYCVASYVGEE